MEYNQIAPEGSYISNYMKYMNEVETATIYDFWCAVWTIGVGVGYDCYVNRPRVPVFLNWYLVLAASSGTTRKSTAVESALAVVAETARAVNFELHGEYRPTPGRLTKYFDKEREGYLAVPELVTVMGREPYMSGMPGALTDLYDGRRGFLSFLSASTPTWLVSHINQAVIEGGFTSRCLFIVEEQAKRRIAWPAGGDQAELVDGLTTLMTQAKKTHSISVNKVAMESFTTWYSSRKEPQDEYYKSLFARADDHVLRLAACLCLNDGTHQIQDRHIGYAIQCIDDVVSRGGSLFAVDALENKARLLGVVDKVRRVLIEAGMDGKQHNLLYRTVVRKVSTQEFHLLMSIMHEIGCVQRFEIKVEKGRPKTVYRATKALESAGLTESILSRV